MDHEEADPLDLALGAHGPREPDLDDKTKASLKFDLVSRISGYDTIARRYGFDGEAGLVKFLQKNLGFAQEVGRLRAMFSSDMGAAERARLKALLASEEAITDIFGIATDGGLSASVRIDAFKQLNRMGGVDGLPPAAKEAGGGGGGGTQFSLVINMPGSEGKPGRQEKIFTTVVEHDTEGGANLDELDGILK